jgi:phosphoglycolate phosphatase-like HAD superfamily hydrolase
MKQLIVFDLDGTLAQSKSAIDAEMARLLDRLLARQQTVGIWREVDADDCSFLVHDMIDESRVLVGEAVVILSPDMGGQQIVQ